MHRSLILLSLALLASVAQPQSNEALVPLARQKVDLLILGATAIDPGTGSIVPNSLVALKNGLIEAVGNADDAAAFDATTILNGSGQFIIPAFVDMHSHWGNGTFFEDETLVETTLARHLYYGVSRILNLGSNFASPAEIEDYRHKLAEGIWRGPEIYAVGALITVPGSHPTTTIFPPDVQDQIAQRLATALPTGPIDLNPIRAITLVRTPEDIRAEVRRLAAWGADAIKITVEDGPAEFGEHPRMSEQLIRAAVEEAHREGIRVIAHISDLEELKLVLDAGVDAAAHSSDVGTDAIHRQMGEAGFFYITTLAMYEGLIDWFGHPERMDDPFLRESLRDEEAAVMQNLNANDLEGEPFSATFDHVRAAHQAGAILLTGTDTGNPFSFPGYGIHQELRLFVEAGVEPLDALAAASVNAARFFGEEHLWGSLVPGQAADLIILDGDPLVDILNTQNIAYVIQAGAVVDRASLVGKMGTSQD